MWLLWDDFGRVHWHIVVGSFGIYGWPYILVPGLVECIVLGEVEFYGNYLGRRGALQTWL